MKIIHQAHKSKVWLLAVFFPLYMP